MAVRGIAFRLGLCVMIVCHFIVGFGMSGPTIAAPTVPAPTVNPGAMTGGTSISVKASVDITDSTLITGSLQLLQVNEANAVIARLGVMTDDGVAPDLVAGDRVYVKQVVITAPSTPGKVRLRVSAAFTGMLQRVLSDVTVIDVTSSGIPTGVGVSDPTKLILDAATNVRFLSNEVLVIFKEGTSLAEVQRVAGLISGKLVGRIPELSLWQIEIPDTGALAGVQGAIGILLAQLSVEAAEPNVIPEISSHQAKFPNSEYLSQIGLSNAHAKSIGAGIKVAIIDTGVDPDASGGELKGNLITPGKNYVSILPGDPPRDEQGHGTHVTGIAQMVAPASKLIPIRSLSGDCDPIKSALKNMASVFKVTAGVVYAANEKVNIINMSLETPSLYKIIVQSAVRYAQSKGVLIVASAGNNNSSDPQVPAALEGVLSVGAVDFTGIISSSANSNFGTWVKIYAPGDGIFSTWPSYDVSLDNCPFTKSGDYMRMSGTSQAAPFVSGVAALAKAISPDLKASDLNDIIVKSGVPSEQRVSGIYKKANRDPDGNIICILKADGAVSMAKNYDVTAKKRKACSGPFVAVHHPGGTSSVDFTVTIDGSLSQRISVGADTGDIVYLTNPLTTINPLSLADSSAFPALSEGKHAISIFLNLLAGEFKVAGYTLTLSPGLQFSDGTTTKTGVLNRAIRSETHDFEILADSGGTPPPPPPPLP